MTKVMYNLASKSWLPEKGQIIETVMTFFAFLIIFIALCI